MITIKKIKQIKELFSTNTNDVFEYEWRDGDDGAAFNSGDTEYLVTFEDREMYGIEFLEIAYGNVISNIEVGYTPKSEGFNTDKVKVINTVIKIIKEKLSNSHHEGLYFSGAVSNGLAGFYNLIIKSLKLKNDYHCFQEREGEAVIFFLISKSFKYSDDGHSEIIVYDNDRLISFNYSRLDIYIETRLSNLKTVEPINHLQVLKKLIDEYHIFYDLDSGDTVNINWDKNISMNDQSRSLIKDIIEKYGLVFENNYKTSMEFTYPSNEENVDGDEFNEWE